ncbi:MAG: NADH-quinone oxidoreductase subunit N [Deltaproteobacteria bacterium]|nr:NADH-quinone oxidoreductase subunit N [Deltaproteobacteria bacterium]
MSIEIPTINLTNIGPLITLSVAGLLLLLVDAFSIKGTKKGYFHQISLVAVVIAVLQTIWLWGRNEMDFSRMIYVDNYSFFFYLIFLLGTGVSILLSVRYLENYNKNYGEYYALMLFAAVGMMLMAAGGNLVTIFLGVEILSIPIYIMAGMFREDLKSNESALKYLLLGAFSSAFLLFGIAMLYGATGTFFLEDIAKVIKSGGMNALTYMGLGLLIVGLGFKVSLAPFHMWTPDVYEGAPTSVTAFMSVGTKAAAFAVFLRIFMDVFPTVRMDWDMLLWVLAVATMTVGNVTALAQTNIKRMLAYSSIAHAGYILIGMIAGNQLGAIGILYYLVAYTLMNLGAFGVVILVSRKKDSYLNIYDYSGLGFQYPGLALVMSVFMFGLVGMPPTAGFIGKFYIFSAAIEANYIWLVLIGVVNSLISVYYYLRITVIMYMKPAEADLGPVDMNATMTTTLIASAVAVLIIGIFPSSVFNLALSSVKIFGS